ncbi:pectinesterase family protein [Cellvibrio mixtus]|uniref:pectinesterase family protein n=1 Tax=Cellvibrio mixtus TaxID=39650 RepID=UPI00126A1F05|nr:pectinesterase family protein [Cellvibrio mixtus]
MRTHLLTALGLALVLSACGGDSKKGGSHTSSTPTGTNQSSAPVIVASSAQAQSSSPSSTAPTLASGVFVDAFVAGISYRTETQSGVTNARGEFNYLPGETVTFSIGDLVFPPVPAKSIVTPLDMAQTLNPASPVVLNIARLLQTLDTDGDPANGITISPTAAQFAATVDFNLSLAQFAASPAVVNLVANSGSVNTIVVSVQQALNHLRNTLTLAGVPMVETSSSAQSSAPVVATSSSSSSSVIVVVPPGSSSTASSTIPVSSSAPSSSPATLSSSSQSSSATPVTTSAPGSSSLATSSSVTATSVASSAPVSSAAGSSLSSSSSSVAGPDFNTVFGFASLNGGTTGGSGADKVEVAVCTGAEITAALANPAYSGKPLTIYVDGVVTWHNAGNSDIKLNRPNVSIIGRGANAEFWGTGIHITASNVIVRNLKMYHVPQSRGQGDIITIDGRTGPVRNVWIDHNELFNDLNTPIPATITDPVLRDEYKKDYYDELVSGRSDVADITISYNYLHDSWKTSLWGSSDDDAFDRRITWHHNHWHHVNSRLPLFRYGKGHIYNNYYNGVDTSAINSRMGAIIRVERNVFENTKNPVLSQDSRAVGYWELIENQLRQPIIWVDKEDTVDTVNIIADELLADSASTGHLTLPAGYLYLPSLIATEDVPGYVQQYAGVGKINTAPATLSCPRPEWDIEPPPPPGDEPVTADPTTVNWSIFNGDLSPFAADSITLANGSKTTFGIQGSASDFTATGTGSVLFDSTALTTKNNRARVNNVAGTGYPKYFTLIAGIKGFNPPTNARVIELEAALGGDAEATSASRLKVVLRADGTNQGVQFEGAALPSTAYGMAMDQYRVYHFTVAMTNPTTGWIRAYLDGSNTPILAQEEVQMLSTPAANNYLQIGDGGGNSYKALIDWVVWTDTGAYTPAQLTDLLPANIGCVKGYGASENLSNCDFSGIGVTSSSAVSSSVGSSAGDTGSSAGTSSGGVIVGSSTSAATSSAPDTSSSGASSSVAPAFACSSEPGLYFCDDFASGSGKWDLLPVAGPNGLFDILNDAGNNNVLRYTAASSGGVGGVLALIKPEQLAAVTSGDYYVEARIRPRLNASGTAQRSIYVMARYQDVNNWYGVGMIAHESSQPRVEIVERNSASNPASTGAMRYPTTINLGTAGATNGEWYKLRLEMIGTEMTLYLNDLAVGSFSDASLTQRGLIGIFTSNRSFEIDDIKVGNANDKPPVPSQLTISPAAEYNAEVGDDPLVITVTAKNQQNGNDTFTVESSNPAVVSASINGNQVSLDPVGAGTATITFTSGSDPNLTRTLGATIAPQFVMPTATYNLSGRVTPAASETGAYADTSLTLTFDSPPVLGSAGSIRIFKSSDDSLVDTIKLVGHKDNIGYSTYRTLNTRPISISGNTATIALQSKKLDYNTSYYVAVSGSAFTGATLATLPFEGIGKNAGWNFTTRPAPAAGLTALTVDDNGTSADFRTLQGALNYVMQNLTKSDPATITVKNGTYPELLYLRNKDNLTITGESREGVVIQYQNSEALNAGSAGRPVFLVELADLLALENLTLKNTTIKTSSGGQAETIYFNSTGRLIAKNANFISEQDTLQLKGYSWFYRTLVAGNVDFIWGNNNVSLFEESEIRSLGDSSNASNGGYVVQARTLTAADKGFVFLNSNLTQGAGPVGHTIPVGATYLARSPGTAATWDNVVFINSRMDTHINAAGWAVAGVNGQPAPNPVTPSATTGWREFATMDASGTTINLASRVGGRELSLAEVASDYCNRAQIFAAYNGGAGWDPLPGDSTDCVNFGHSGSSAGSSSSAASTASSSDTSSAASSTETSASSSSASSTPAGDGSSSSSSAAATLTKTWGFDSAAYATADTSLFGAAYSASADNGIKVTGGDITVDGLVFNSTAANVLRYRAAGSANNATATAVWNTNGSFFTNNATLIPAVGEDLPSNVRTYIAVPVESGKALALSISYRQTGANTVTAGKFALVGSDGKVLAVKDASYANASAGDSITLTLDASHSQTAVKLIYGREGLASGGVNILEIVRNQ